MLRTLSRRRGFTLIELMVVIAIIIVIAGLAVLISQSSAFASQQVVGSADRASQWLLISKQRAKRDNAPRGVRFLVNPQSHPIAPGQVTDALYIEQPDPWVPVSSYTAKYVTPTGNINNPNLPPPQQTLADDAARIVFVYLAAPPAPPMSPPNPFEGMVFERRCYFVTCDLNELDDFDKRILPGDKLVLNDINASFRIKAIGGHPTLPAPPYQPFNLFMPVRPTSGMPPVTPAPFIVGTGPAPAILQPAYQPATPGVLPFYARQLHLEGFPDLGPGATHPAPIPNSTAVRYQFSFQLAPRPLMGENPLQLTLGTIIDYRAPRTLNTVPAMPFGLPGPTGPFTISDYQDWNYPSPASVGTPNPPPYWPTTTSGVVLNSDPAGPFFDIVFAPSGQVLDNTSGVICLWVRQWDLGSGRPDHPRLGDWSMSNQNGTTQLDQMAQYDAAGEQILIAISTRAGLIATHPIVPPPPAPTTNYDPYRNAKDGVNSGL